MRFSAQEILVAAVITSAAGVFQAGCAPQKAAKPVEAAMITRLAAQSPDAQSLQSRYESISQAAVPGGARLNANDYEAAPEVFIKPQEQTQPAKSSPPMIAPERKIEKVYYSEGPLFSETNLFSDKNNGFYKTYHRNGRLATEIRYQNGWQSYDKAFDEQGRPVIRNGIYKTYYADGTVASLGEYRHDLKNGKEEFYFYDGKTIVDVWHFLNGRKVASHVRNDALGNFVSEEDWGYPTYYVRKLQFIILILSVSVIILLVCLMLHVRKKSV